MRPNTALERKIEVRGDPPKKKPLTERGERRRKEIWERATGGENRMSIKKDSNLQYQIFYRGHLSPARTSGPFSIDTGVTGHEAFPSQSALHGEASQPGHTDRTPAPSLASSTSRPTTSPPLGGRTKTAPWHPHHQASPHVPADRLCLARNRCPVLSFRPSFKTPFLFDEKLGGNCSTRHCSLLGVHVVGVIFVVTVFRKKEQGMKERVRRKRNECGGERA